MDRSTLALSVVVVTALFTTAAPTMAQVQRKFPADALRGALVVESTSEVSVNGTLARLAPGARIRGQNNMLAMSGAITGQRLLANYTIDMNGHVKDVWVLTPEEAARQPWPTTPQQAASWSFDSAQQVWTRN